MIAARSHFSSVPSEDQQRFLGMLPRIKQYASIQFQQFPADQQEELVAEVVGLAWGMFSRLVERRRTECAFATPLANFAVRQVRCGRGLGLQGNVSDVGSRLCKLQKGIHVESIQKLDQQNDEWRKSMVQDRRQSPIPDRVAFLIDFPAWLLTLSQRDRRIVELLSAGERAQQIARRFHVTAGRISQLRRELREKWRAFTADKEATEPLVGIA